MSDSAHFPFGDRSTPREPRRPSSGPARCFVLGVYPSALHVQWRLPAWAHEAAGRAVIGALAISDEPEVFWDGTGVKALVDDWASRCGFKRGDGADQWGQVSAAGNGTSGRPVRDHVLSPLGLVPGEVWFTDAVNTYFVKTGAGQQGEALAAFNKVADRLELPAARLPERPVPEKLIELAASDHRERLRAELVEASAPIVVTLGEEARRVLAAIADRTDGRLTRPLTASDTPADSYGTAGNVTVGAWTGTWYALVHPGNRSKLWRGLQAGWVERMRTAAR